MPAGLFKTVLVRNFTAVFDYKANAFNAVSIVVSEFSDATKSIFKEFRKYKVSAAKLTMLPLTGRAIANRVDHVTTDVTLPLMFKFMSSEQALNNPTLISDPSVRTLPYGRTINLYRKVRTPLVVGAQHDSARVDIFPRTAPWISTEDINVSHGSFCFATPNYPGETNVCHPLYFNVNLKVYVALRDHIA